MANPNIVNVSDIRGKTAVLAVTTSATAIVSNSAESNKIFKINSLTIANVDGVNSADITVDIFRSSVAYKIAHTIAVPADATLVVVSKDTSIYLEEGDSLRCTASANSDLEAVCSYEEIS
jgi:hypothetical protein